MNQFFLCWNETQAALCAAPDSQKAYELFEKATGCGPTGTRAAFADETALLEESNAKVWFGILIEKPEVEWHVITVKVAMECGSLTSLEEVKDRVHSLLYDGFDHATILDSETFRLPKGEKPL